MVIATQNPQSQRGTFPLVESQLDRFAMATSLGYPDAAHEAQLALHGGGKYALAELLPVCTTEEWLGAQRATESVPVQPSVADVRGRALPGEPDGAGRASRRQPARRHLARSGPPRRTPCCRRGATWCPTT